MWTECAALKAWLALEVKQTLGPFMSRCLFMSPHGSMANIVVELHDGSVLPMELPSNPVKTAAQVLNACARTFHKGAGALSP